MAGDEDQLFVDGTAAPGSFRFDARVARVFDDMIRRSVPGYVDTVSRSGWLAARFAQPHTACYDLGCSLGATLLACADAMHERGLEGVKLIGVDTSGAMLERCRVRLQPELGALLPRLIEADISELAFEPASVVILNWTLQFLSPALRQPLLERIHSALLPGGALILSEKVVSADADAQALLERLHEDFKRSQGYSEMEIAAKRTALEAVLVPDSVDTHLARLRSIGFAPVLIWYRQLNFVSLLAVKP